VALLNFKQLPQSRILLGQEVPSERGLFELIARTVAGGDGLMERRVRDRLARRHARQSAALGAAVALPHAAIPALTSTRAVYIRCCSPIPMATPDEKGITDVLAIVVPPPGLAADYDLLMSLTAFLQHPDKRSSLQRARSPAEVQAILLGEG